MKKIVNKLWALVRKPWRVEYRMTVIVDGNKTMNTYSSSRKVLMGVLNRTEGTRYWTLYKKGPLGIGERAVDFGEVSQ